MPSPLATPRESPPSPISPMNLPASEKSEKADTYFATSPSPRLDPIIEHVKSQHAVRQRGKSPSISFKAEPLVRPTVETKPKESTVEEFKLKSKRPREPSPPAPCRFLHHVSFDNFTGGEPTEKNTVSFTLNVKHKGYQFKRRSRTFMVGIDEHDYSNIALQWMLNELVDDGDEIVCLRVVEKDAKITNDRSMENKMYRKAAMDLLEYVQSMNDDNRAISIVLEFAIGKIHSTFQKMIQLYEPAMLIVGTRGRSLGGFQGLVSNRNSFSKWCLQYSPVPVVVVRPTEKRNKKKEKRHNDPTRQDYARIMKENGMTDHETSTSRSNSVFEIPYDPEKEASAVAAAVGLSQTLDDDEAALEGGAPLKKVDSGRSDVTSASQESQSPDSRPNSPGVALISKPDSEAAGSGDEYSDEDEEEGDFDVVDGRSLLDHAGERERPEIEEAAKKQKLHDMEADEAAMLKSARQKLDEDEAEEEGRVEGSATQNSSEEQERAEENVEETEILETEAR